MIKKKYIAQKDQWPDSGRHILAQFDDDTILVYQAYRSSIGNYAVSHQEFGGDFSYNRMSWIKTNFLWMMYRSGWGKKSGQEIVLAIRITRSFFDKTLELAVAANYQSSTGFANESDWKEALQSSDVRLQWDPDHDPVGNKEMRKAIQIGLRNDVLREYGKESIVEITDVSSFVKEQYAFANQAYEELWLPEERVYIPESEKACKNIGLI